MRKRHLAVCGMMVALGVSSLTACGTKKEAVNTENVTEISTEASNESEVSETEASEAETSEELEEPKDDKSETSEDVLETAVDAKPTSDVETVVIEGFEDNTVHKASADQIKEFNSKNPYFDVNADAAAGQDITLVEYCAPGTDDIVYGAMISTPEETEAETGASTDGEMSVDFNTQAASLILEYRNRTGVTKDQFMEVKNKVGEGDALTKDDLLAWSKVFASGMTGLDLGEDSIMSGAEFDYNFSEDIINNVSDDDINDYYAGMYTNRKISDVSFVQAGINFIMQMNFGVSVADNDTDYALYELQVGGSQNLNDIITFKNAEKHYKSDTVAEMPETDADAEESAEDLNISIDN